MSGLLRRLRSRLPLWGPSRGITEPPRPTPTTVIKLPANATPADVDRWWRKAQDRQVRLDAAIRAERDPEPVDMAGAS